ncbi:SpoIIE family protein phosphatase [Solirubrobacter soli]|uniref:SpoIIE family protein phosphatase n=1 Tax=Solirubrobacter soli TaxID=363832 RepID=UPI0004110283|nr:SpoIIE family protein phosphatase [Solirubrobacter soli]
MSLEPALSAALDVEPILDVLPVPLLLVEPGTARMLYANEAAHRLAGGTLTLGVPAEEYPRTYRLYDASGRALEPDEMPAVRAARGEVLHNVQVDWETPRGICTVLVSGSTISLDGGRQVTLVTFEDVTELEGERRRSSLLADELRVMLDNVADAITVQSPDHKLIYANEAAARHYGIPGGTELSAFDASVYLRRFEATDELGRPLDLARLPGRLALAGLDPEPVVIRSRDLETGEIKWARVKATAVHDPDGGVRLAINVIEDITSLKRSEEAQRFLAEASRRLSGSSLDYERTLAAVTELAVPSLADACAVHFVEEEALPSEVAEVIRTGAAWLEPSRVIVPMTSGRVIGTLTLTLRGRVFDSADVLVAEDFGLRAGAAVENARLYRAASLIARTLQTSLLPPVLPDVPGAAVAAAFHPAGEGLEVGGDFYDVFTTGDGQWYLVMGDVSGKGAQAAAVTALARYTLRTAAARRRSPAAILRWVGEAMLDQGATGGHYCTIACALVDLSRSPARLTVSCGGHPLPALRRADGTVEPVGAPGTLLGLLPDPELQDRSTDLRPGDTLVLYTDGLTEARAPGPTWGFEELAAAVRVAPMDGPESLVTSLVASALGDRAAPRDDLAVLALKLDA